jgi:hypothetical protein
MKVDINKIREYEEFLSQVNRTPLEDIEFFDGDKKVEFIKEFIDEFPHRGLCNTDLILDEDYFLRGQGIDPNDQNFNPVEESL